MTTTASAIEVRSLGNCFGETGPLVLDDGAWRRGCGSHEPPSVTTDRFARPTSSRITPPGPLPRCRLSRLGAAGGAVRRRGGVIRNAERCMLGVEARGIPFISWTGWLTRDAHERTLGEADESAVTRERVKVVPRQERVSIGWDSTLSAR